MRMKEGMNRKKHEHVAYHSKMYVGFINNSLRGRLHLKAVCLKESLEDGITDQLRNGKPHSKEKM